MRAFSSTDCSKYHGVCLRLFSWHNTRIWVYMTSEHTYMYVTSERSYSEDAPPAAIAPQRLVSSSRQKMSSSHVANRLACHPAAGAGMSEHLTQETAVCRPILHIRKTDQREKSKLPKAAQQANGQVNETLVNCHIYSPFPRGKWSVGHWLNTVPGCEFPPHLFACRVNLNKPLAPSERSCWSFKDTSSHLGRIRCAPRNEEQSQDNWLSSCASFCNTWWMSLG